MRAKFDTTTSKVLLIIVIIATILEMVFFPSLANFCGCAMAMVVCLIYCNYFLKRDIIIKYPFLSVTFFSIFMYRYLPLFATLLEGKPITFGMENPIYTFLYETILFIVASIAMKLTLKTSRQNGILQRLWNNFGLYKAQSSIVLWTLGFIGLFSFLYTRSLGFGSIEMGDVGNKFLQGLIYLQYAPICMLFPNLFGSKISKKNKILLIVYISVMLIIAIASNGRQNMVYPFVSIAAMCFLNILILGKKLSQIISPTKAVFLCVGLYYIIGFFGDMSQAQLATRGERKDNSLSEQLETTMNAYSDDKVRQRQQQEKEIANTSRIVKYNQGWTEIYVRNDFLNRFCNIRITDETLYHYLRSEDRCRPALLADFSNRIIATFPTPILRFWGSQYDKTQGLYSRGDLLYSISSGRDGYGGYRVTSHVGDGLATFGWLYFVIQFVLFFLVFKFLVSFSYFSQDGKTLYSVLGLISFSSFIIFISNANGCVSELIYMMRGYWQKIILYLVAVYLCSFVVKILKGIKQ